MDRQPPLALLAELRVRDYALIKDLVVEFGPGLTVLTGETGAGKSIVVGALSLLLGGRPDSDMVRTGADSAQVEGRFRVRADVAEQCRSLGIDPGADSSLILRRRVERSGRGAAYANDSGVSMAGLERLGDRLVDLHGQHQHQFLLKPEVHLDILDSYAGLDQEREAFRRCFEEFEAARAELATLDHELAARRARRELTEFQARELADAAVQPDETETLNAERELLQSAERRHSLAHELRSLLSEGEVSTSGLLVAAAKALAELARIDPRLAERRAALSDVQAVLDELWRELVRYDETIEFSAEQLDTVNARLFLIEKLARKHSTPPAELPRLAARLKAELEGLETSGERRSELARRIQAASTDLVRSARSLSRQRTRSRRQLEEQLHDEFPAAGLDRAELKVSLTREPDPDGVYEEAGARYRLTGRGVDAAEFLFSANPGEELRPLRKVASGGELSRIMLALKAALAHVDPVPTMVFDEIDSGIGGRVAEAVGRKLARLARTHQVICITHLPQIAQYAERHLVVEKSTRAGRSTTAVRPLDDEERVAELARMAGGAKVTNAGLAHAREMLDLAGRTRRE